MQRTNSEERLIRNLKTMERYEPFIEATLMWLETDESMDKMSEYIESKNGKADFYDVNQKVVSFYD